ncbi:MAG: phospholipase D-like domain-containing protein [Pseudomonadota bacterium]
MADTTTPPPAKPIQPRPDFEVFVTADQAFAAFEEAVLSARSSVIGGFRIFDMRTPLLSAGARAVGTTWFDLLVHVVRRGVRFDLSVSDFDPVFAPALHQLSWITVKQGANLAEAAGAAPGQVNVRALRHPVTPGLVPWLAFLPAGMAKARAHRHHLRKAARLTRTDVSSQLPRLHPITHHQKLAVIDSDTLYIGGLDLNERRFDTAEHDRPAAQTWSDVQVMLRHDPAVAEARTHLDSFDRVVHGRAAPPQTHHLKRTLSRDRAFKLPFLSPCTVLSEIEELHRTAIHKAKHLIYIETQFMRSRPMADAMAQAAQQRRDLSLILILPALPEPAAFEATDEIGLETRYGLSLEADALEILRGGFGDRATVASPVQPVMAPRDGSDTLAGSPIIYVHNKVLVQDDSFGFVSSANVNGRSFFWDTEVGLQVTQPARLRHLRQALSDHWWRGPRPDGWLAPERMQALWQAEIARNTVRRPEARTGFLVHHSTAVHQAEGQALPLMTDNMV